MLTRACLFKCSRSFDDNHNLLFKMGKGKQISAAVRAQIVALSQHSTKTHREIASDLQISHSAVTKIINKFHETGTVSPRKGRGRQPCTSNRTDLAIRREVMKNPFITARSIKANLTPMCDNISLNTIRDRLGKKFGMPARKPIKKPQLTLKMRKARLEFCRRYSGWGVDEWKCVLFTDESNFLQHDCTPTVVRRPPGASPLNPRYTAKTVKHSSGVMVWGCFAHRGRGALTFLDRGARLNSAMYIGILEEKLHLFMHTLQCSIVQQDNAPCHASRATKKWFAENNVEVLDWPGNSPDLNPIENLWQTVKLKMKRDRCTSISALKNELRRVWCLETTPETCATLVESMPRRIRAVMQNKGFPTKY